MNPVALITGASRGIGRGIALELAAAGYDVVLNFVENTEAAQRTAADCRAAARARAREVRVEPCRADVAVGADRQRLVEFTRTTFGRLDLLVNNAGVAPTERADLIEAGEASFDRVMNTNVKGPYFLTQLAARWMLEQVGAAPGGIEGARPDAPKIITITSISAYTASVDRGEYCLAKAALAMLTPLFAARLAPHGILVYEIRPGIVATDMTRPVQAKYDALIAGGLTPLARWGTPADVGRAVVALARGDFAFSTGEVLNVDGGFHLRRL